MEKLVKLRFVFLLGAVFFTIDAWGQRPSTGNFDRFNNNNGNIPSDVRDQDEFEVDPDTSDIFFFYADNPNR